MAGETPTVQSTVNPVGALPPEIVTERAYELAGVGVTDASAQELAGYAGGDRRLLESARNLVAARLHNSVDDWSATAALMLLNRALATMPREDPLDWRIRWGQRFRMP
jgi:hypothetical protein